ncbi:unnamed protein product [Effrenium voratum]|uniref:Uncharacterized protein n=1 Tax=Effrenium voratum TaxID=2562239 RepID=A0AA36HVR9_9DINO|nr:unnamed protein product [Effrenium voratum]CAJ1376256.1 unnamed protein product [Effrenium voratum]CAJ1413391.1 unnamed protein product [Effrenium voratum]|mmetsp:Transcript_53276/g.127447  ORF Transcript_53276/g.127447 Transcript_53276/m.127447 type:complete len:113 (+) Transcript_53276:95-433(+)
MGSEKSSAKKAATKKRAVKQAAKEPHKGKETQARKKEPAKAKKAKALTRAQEAALVEGLIQGAPGIAAPQPLPLSALTKHKGVAWQWLEGGRMQYPIPIGCKRPLSPFNSDD